MGNKKDMLPIAMASVIAFIITVIVRWMLPGGTVVKQGPIKKELSLPDIPLMIKEEKKKTQEVQVLVTSAEFKKDEKITMAKLTWKNWPVNALQPQFIAQDTKGVPLNNKSDLENAQRMWAKNDIPLGIPLIMGMLTSDDPAVIAAALKKKKEEEEAKKRKLAEKKDTSLIKVGYRAVTFSVDQRSAVSSDMINPGDLIDVLINGTDNEGKSKTYVYKAVKLLAIDGITKVNNNKNEQGDQGGLFSGIVSGIVSPKNVTLEIKENKVQSMLRQAGNNGIMISLRSQSENEANPGEEEVEEEEIDTVDETFLSNVMAMNRRTSSEILRESRQKKEDEERNIAALLYSMNSIGLKNQKPVVIVENDPLNVEEENKNKDENKNKNENKDTNTDVSKESSKYEIVSGRVLSDSSGEKEREIHSVKIYRKLAPDEVQFDKNGKKVTDGSGASVSGGIARAAASGIGAAVGNAIGRRIGR